MKTALILGGGGPIGIAWEAGLLLGLEESGIELAKIDRIVGTSAGAIVGAHLAVLGSTNELYAAQATPLENTIKPPNMAPLMAAMAKAKLFSWNVEGKRRSLGKSARAANVPGEQQWLDAIASFLPHQDGSPITGWPSRDLFITAIDAVSGELISWTRGSNVPLPLAVASSCAVPCVYPLVHINEILYMDGGMGSPTNSALAAGYDLVIIADPLARTMGPLSAMQAEKAALVKQGSRVLSLVFDDATASAIGMNLMDMGKRKQVAELGRTSGRRAAQLAGDQRSTPMSGDSLLDVLR